MTWGASSFKINHQVHLFSFFIILDITVVIILIKFSAFLLPGLWSARGLKYPWKGPRSTADCQVDDGGGDDDAGGGDMMVVEMMMMVAEMMMMIP